MSVQADRKRAEFDDYSVDQDVYGACAQIRDIHNLKSFAATLRFLVNQYWLFTEAGGLFCTSCGTPVKFYCVACGEIRMMKQITGVTQPDKQCSDSTSAIQDSQNALSNGTLSSSSKEELEIPVQNLTKSHRHGASELRNRIKKCKKRTIKQRKMRPHECTRCGAAFFTNWELTQHKKRHSHNFKPHKCEWCPYTSKCTRDLEAHLRRHTGEKPYKCKLCGKCFGRKDSLQKHANTRCHVAPPIP